jgi:hypothetical protein
MLLVDEVGVSIFEVFEGIVASTDSDEAEGTTW